MSTNRIPRVTRRRFLKNTGLTTCRRRLGTAALRAVRVARLGRQQVAVDRAMEPLRSRSTTTGSTSSPRTGARRTRSRSRSTIFPVQNVRRARGRGSVGRIGTRSVRIQRRRRRASLPQIFHRRCRSREGNREEVRQGQHHRPAARLQRGRQDLVCLPRLLHQLPRHVSQEHVGRDRDAAGHLGQLAHRRRQAEGERPPGRHFARAQQRPEHDLARPVVELWRRRSGRGTARRSCSTARRRSKPSSTSPRSTRKR